jgi:Na+/melibiose symporter-like transporter
VSIQELLIELGAVVLLCSSVVLVRLRLLSIRYGLGWITVSLIGIAAGPVLVVLSGEVKRFGLTPTGFSLGVLIVFLGLLCLQLSISLSGLHRAIQDLSEHGALVEERLRRLEEARQDETEAEDAFAHLGDRL